jgi:hypothetical protein
VGVGVQVVWEALASTANDAVSAGLARQTKRPPSRRMNLAPIRVEGA